MSIENSINELIVAIKEQTAALLKTRDTVTTTVSAGDVSKTVTKAADVKPEVKKPTTPPAEKPGAATVKPGADQKASAAASSIDYAETIKPKILAFAKMTEGRDKLTALLQRFGVSKGPDLLPAQHAEFNEKIDLAMAGEWDPRDADPAGDESDEDDEGMA